MYAPIFPPPPDAWYEPELEPEGILVDGPAPTFAGLDPSSLPGAGLQYVDDQLLSDHFRDWVWDQLHEAREMERRDPSSIAKGLETATIARKKGAAVELAQRMLQQLRWDIGRDISDDEVEPYFVKEGIKEGVNQKLRDAFSTTVRQTLESDATEKWLAEEFIMPIAKELLKR